MAKEEKIAVADIPVEMVEVEASNVSKIGYNDKEKILGVEFNNETLYYYLDIPKEHYDEMLKCKSIGSYMHRNIKGNFRYIRVK